MENNSNELTNDQLQEISDTLENNASEDVKVLRGINEDINIDAELEEAYIESDDGLKESNKSIFDLSKIDNKDKEESLKKVITTDNTLNDEEASQLFAVIMRYSKKEKFNIYNELPERFKNVVRNIAINSGGTKAQYNIIAAGLLDEFIQEANIDKEFVDIQNAINNELDIIPSLADMSLENTRDIMETQLLKTIDNIKEEYPDKANLLIKISEVFTTTYTMSTLIEFLQTNRKARNKVAEDNPDYEKFCRDFNNRADKSMFKIRDVNFLASTLNRVLPVEEVSNDDIRNFVILFCKYCKELEPNKIENMVYMYYFINDIIMLDYNYTAKTEFSNTLIANIINCIKEIRKCQESYEERFPKRKKTH